MLLLVLFVLRALRLLLLWVVEGSCAEPLMTMLSMLSSDECINETRSSSNISSRSRSILLFRFRMEYRFLTPPPPPPLATDPATGPAAATATVPGDAKFDLLLLPTNMEWPS